MPFDLVAPSSFYTCTMGKFKTEGDSLFIKKYQNLAKDNPNLGSYHVTMSETELFLNGKNISLGTKLIIDGILIWSNNIHTIIL